MPRRWGWDESNGTARPDPDSPCHATNRGLRGTFWHLSRYQWAAWLILAVAWLVVALWLASVLARLRALEQHIEHEQRQWEIEDGD